MTMTGRVLDLFAGPGGAARGFQRVGYDVLGVDIAPHPKYPARCVEHDLRDGLPPEVSGESFDFVWASPPCIPFTTIGGESTENLIPLARDLVHRVDTPVWMIENVPGARDELRNPVCLSGATEHELIDLNIRKERLFEVSWWGTSPPRDRSASFEYAIGSAESPPDGYRRAHGLPDSGLNQKELRDAIPPDYVALLLWQYGQTSRTDLPHL